MFQFNVNFSVTANPNLAARTGFITITQQDGTKATETIQQAATTGDFSLPSVTPGSQSIISTKSTTYTVNINRSGAFAGVPGAVFLSVPSGLPAGATASFSPNPATGPSSTLTITTTSATPFGTFPFTIRGTSGSVTHDISASLTVSLGVAKGITTAVNPIANTMDVDYIGTDGHVHQFFYNGTWNSADLSALAGGAPNASQTGGIKAINNTIAGTMEVHYIGIDQHVHTLYYDGTWHHVDLTGGVQNAALNSSITATMDPVANTEDVEYIGSNHVYEVWYNGTWHTADLTTASGAAPNADSSSGMNTLMNTIGNGMEVEYIGTDHHVYALWYLVGGGGIWHFTDLTSTTGNPVAAAGSPLTSTMDSIANTEDLEYIGSDHHVYELWYNGLWHPADITSLVNAGANADITGGIHTLNNTIANAMEVHYIGTDQHVYSFWYPSGGGGVWHISDLTSLTPAASSIAGSPLASAADSVAGTIDLTYVGADQHVHVLSYNGSWHETVLTAP